MHVHVYVHVHVMMRAACVMQMEELARDKSCLADIRLPVFCVSARDANRLEGRCRNDGKAGTFRTMEATEIPALRAHVKAAAEQGRQQALKAAAAALSHFIAQVGTSLNNRVR